MKTAKVKPPGVEDWASKVVAAELGTPVAVHDDGSQQSMYDLRVGPPDAPHMAIEVAGAVDPVQTATWNTGPAKGPLHLALKGDWIVTLAPSANMKIVRQALEGVLQQMEAVGLSEADRQFDEKVSPGGLEDQMNAIDVLSANRFREAGSGKVHLTMPGTGGAVDSAGTSVPDWVGTFLAHPSRADVVSKLKNSGAPKAEVAAHTAATPIRGDRGMGLPNPVVLRRLLGRGDVAAREAADRNHDARPSRAQRVAAPGQPTIRGPPQSGRARAG